MRRAVRLVRDLIAGGQRRDVALLRLRAPPDLFQPYDTTAEDRYPHLFDFVRSRVGDGRDRRLLSFGCADGTEVFSLAARFADSRIKGIDINPGCIARARAEWARRGGDSRLTFEVAGSADAEPAQSYDAVFALAVFRHGDLGDVPRCDPLLSFDAFERSVAGLARCLRPGGLFAIRSAAFRFGDTASAAAFEPVFEIGDAQRLPNNPLFGPDHRRIDAALRDDGVFVKRDFA